MHFSFVSFSLALHLLYSSSDSGEFFFIYLWVFAPSEKCSIVLLLFECCWNIVIACFACTYLLEWAAKMGSRIDVCLVGVWWMNVTMRVAHRCRQLWFVWRCIDIIAIVLCSAFDCGCWWLWSVEHDSWLHVCVTVCVRCVPSPRGKLLIWGFFGILSKLMGLQGFLADFARLSQIFQTSMKFLNRFFVTFSEPE